MANARGDKGPGSGGRWLPSLALVLFLAAGYGLGFVIRGDSGAEDLREELDSATADTEDATADAEDARAELEAVLQRAEAAEDELASRESELADLEEELEVLQQEGDGGGGDGQPTEPTPPEPVPDVVGDRLDVARIDLESAGYRVQVVGGGLFGVVVEANWVVCEQDPGPGATGASRVRVVVDRAGYC